MPAQYAAIEPAAEPRTLYQMSRARAARHRSHTMRKYVSKPIVWITPSSYSRRARASGGLSG